MESVRGGDMSKDLIDLENRTVASEAPTFPNICYHYHDMDHQCHLGCKYRSEKCAFYSEVSY